MLPADWAFSEEALTFLHAWLETARAGSASTLGLLLWKLLMRCVRGVSLLASQVLDIALQGRGAPAGPPPQAAALLATLCKRERLLDLLDLAAEVLGAEVATGAETHDLSAGHATRLALHRDNLLVPA